MRVPNYSQEFCLLKLLLPVSLAIASSASLVGAQDAPVFRQGGSGEVSRPDGYSSADADFGAAMAIGDYDGDGREDLLVGSPLWFDGIHTDGGAFTLFRGTDNGLSDIPSYWSSGAAASSTFAGRAVAMGDFDGDGRDEFAISSPGRWVSADQAGQILISDYVALNFDATLLSQDTAPSLDASEAFDHFGEVLAVGNFNNDDYEDLAVGVPGENLETLTGTYLDAGSVRIFYGSASGIPSLFHQRFDRDFTPALGPPESNENFGAALVAGDFNSDGFDDLAIGGPNRDVFGAIDSGLVVVLFGSSTGLTISGAEQFGTYEVLGVDITGGHFGSALAAGDFQASLLCLTFTCYDDLAVGIPGMAVAGASGTAHGSVAIFSGAGTGLLPVNAPYTIDQSDVASTTSESGDRFGSVLYAGLIDERFGVDLAVGSPDEDWGVNVDQGVVHLFYGGGSDLLFYPRQSVENEASGVASPGVAGDRFGSSIVAGKFHKSSFRDLLVGIPGRTSNGDTGAGMVEILYTGCLFCDGFESGNTFAWN